MQQTSGETKRKSTTILIAQERLRNKVLACSIYDPDNHKIKQEYYFPDNAGMVPRLSIVVCTK